MKDEMHSLTKNKTWNLVEKPTDCKIITCKWVIQIKYEPQGQLVRFKPRLVARGLTQVLGIDFTSTFSPTLRISSFRLLVAIIVAQKLELHHLDVQTTFLHGGLEEEVYRRNPLTIRYTISNIRLQTTGVNLRTTTIRSSLVLSSPYFFNQMWI